MKTKLIVYGLLVLALTASLCACSTPSNESVSSQKTETSVSAPQGAPAGESTEIKIGNDFTVDAGTVLSDGAIYVVGQEGTSGRCAYISTDAGNSWTKEDLPWADQLVTNITLNSDGAMLGVQGQQVVYAPRGENLTSIDLSALGAVDGISCVYPIDANTFTVTGGKTEIFIDEDGNTQETLHPIPFENVVLRYDGSKVAQWGDGSGDNSAGYFASDGNRLYYFTYENNQLCSLSADGQTQTVGKLASMKGSAFCQDGIYYYTNDKGIAAYNIATNASTQLLTDTLAPYLQPNAVCVNLIATGEHVFVVVADITSDKQSVYRYEI